MTEREAIEKQVAKHLDTTDKRALFIKLEFPELSGQIDLEGASKCAAARICEEFRKQGLLKELIHVFYNKFLNGDSFGKWVKSSDRLPNVQGHYLVYCPRSFPKNYKGVVAEFYTDNDTFYSEDNDQPIDDAVCWMPLPVTPN